MSFNQTALAEIAAQTVNGSNLYSYVPANGDSSTDATDTGYFAQSRFVGSDGWINGYIFCVLDDGTFILQIDNTGITAVSLNVTSGDITALQDEVDILQTDMTNAQTNITNLQLNVKGLSLVDMGAGNYTMSNGEAESAAFAVTNEGDGTKTLLIPNTSGGNRPAQQTVVSTTATKGFFLALQSGGASIYVNPGLVINISTTVSGVINVDSYTNMVSRGATNGVRVVSGTTANIDDSDQGKVIKCTNAGATTLTVLNGLLTNNFTCLVYSTGAAGVTVQGDGTSVVSGNTALAITESASICRDLLTENYDCI